MFKLYLDQLKTLFRKQYGKGDYHAEAFFRNLYRRGDGNLSGAAEFSASPNLVRELAAAFHGFYRDCPILRSDEEDDLQQARLWLAEASRVGLSIGLDLLGVDAPEQM